LTVRLLWFAPTNPDPDTYIATVMRRTRDLQPLEELVASLDKKGQYCVQCKMELRAKDHDGADMASHKILPLWVVELVRFAKKHGHFDVLEHVKYSFSIEGVSRVLTHQLVRHRLASYSQISARLLATRDCVIPPLEYINDESLRRHLRDQMNNALSQQWTLYDQLRDGGVKSEDARYIVGDGQMTSLIMTVNARSLGHILRLRLHKDAQWEIRGLAKEILGLVKPTAPIIWEEPIPDAL